MQTAALLLIALAVFAYAVTANRLRNWPLASPALFLALGFAMQAAGLAGASAPEMREPLLVLAEVTLGLVLFSDAARTDARALFLRHVWPARALGVGMPLAIALGFAAAVLLLPGWPVWEAATLAAILAPTDSALAQSVVGSGNLPTRVRRAVTVESGLNDGLALPAVLFFASLAAGAAGAGEETPGDWLGFLATQIGFGAAAGLGVGLAGGRILGVALNRGWLGDETQGVAALGIAAAAYLSAEAIGGNAFVACFAGGLGFGMTLGERPAGRAPQRALGFLAGFLENEGHLLILGAFLMIGADLVPLALERVGWRELALVLLSLFVLRPLAIWLSLWGTDAPARVRLFLGWFGPRGLATALFALLAVDHSTLQRGEDLLAVAATAVVLSAVLHGASAAPAARRFGGNLIPPGVRAD
ncbi:MAG: cation:proton antiporter [Pseudomonadota bacterium]